MSNLKVLISLKSAEDAVSSNSPLMNGINWTRPINGVGSNPMSQVFSIPPGTSQTLFSGTRILAQDSTTVYDLELAPLSTNKYRLSYSSGTAPAFRTLRSIGADATSQVTVTVNGPVTTLTFSGGTLPSLTSVAVGDQVLIGSAFNPLNRGSFQIISKTSSSISVENSSGYPEGPVTLGINFVNQVRIFSAVGVQVGDTLVISGGFSPVSYGSYSVVDVTDYYVVFSYSSVLPQEFSVNTESIAIYSSAKSLIYIETDQSLDLLINGAISGPSIEPRVSNGSASPGLFLLNSTVYSLSVQNKGLVQANVFLASIE